MAEEPITCRFIFTTTEYMRSMRCHWRHPPALWCLVGIVLLFLAVAIYPWFLFGDQRPAGFTGGVSNLFPFAVFFGVFLLSKWFFFITGRAHNKEMTFTLDQEKIHLKNRLADTEGAWKLFRRVTEDKSGFALYWTRQSFHWLPKSGFNSPEAVHACRELLRRSVADSKNLLPA